MSVRRRVVCAALVLYWGALIGGTHYPKAFLPEAKFFLSRDKLVHGVAYMGLAFLLGVLMIRRNAARARSAAETIHTALLVCLFVSTAGFIDEVTQPLVGRDFEFYDWIADTIGAIIGVTSAAVMMRMLSAGDRAARKVVAVECEVMEGAEAHEMMGEPHQPVGAATQESLAATS